MDNVVHKTTPTIELNERKMSYECFPKTEELQTKTYEVL